MRGSDSLTGALQMAQRGNASGGGVLMPLGKHDGEVLFGYGFSRG